MSETQLLPISNCDRLDYEGDIIFVHGLGGDARGAWHPDSKRDNDDFWPVWLGEDLPSFRVWSLDYAIEPFRWKGETMPLVDRATDVLSCLDLEVGDRPIFFIVHSMGGLLVKQMLRHAWDFGDPRWKAIAEQTRGIIYLSTPHSGSDLANWVKAIGTILQASISVDELKAHDSRLRELILVHRNHEFLGQIPIEVYFEKHKTKGALVVNETSADPGIQGVIPIPMDDDHLSICRPKSKQSKLYKRTKRFITDYLQSDPLQPLPELKQKSKKDPVEVEGDREKKKFRTIFLALRLKPVMFPSLISLFCLFLFIFRANLSVISEWYAKQGTQRYIEGQLAMAENYYKQALDIDLSNIKANYNLGVIYEDLQELDKAETQYSIAAHGGIVQAQNNLARLHILEEKPELAIPLLWQGLSSAENETILVRYNLLKNLGWAFWQEGRHDIAESSLHEAIALAEKLEGIENINNRGAAHCLLAQVYQQTEQRKEEIAQWQFCCQQGSIFNTDETKWLNLAHTKLQEAGRSCLF